MNVFRHELRRAALPWLAWTGGLLLTLLCFILIFPPLSRDAALLKQVFDKFPQELIQALGMDQLDLSGLVGYYGFLFTYIVLIGSVFAMKLGISALSEEIRVKTADFLISKPIKRSALVTAKLASVLAQLLAQSVIFTCSALLLGKLVSEQPFDTARFLMVSISLPLVQLFFVALGLLISVLMKRVKTVLPLAMGGVFFFFVLQMLNESMASSSLRFFTPFAYFGAADIIKSGQLDAGFLLLNFAVVVLFVLVSYRVFERKDMPSQ